MTLEYGIDGGGSMYRLGSREHVRSFFIAIDKYVLKEKLYRKIDWSLITDRLYKRTISHDMLDDTIAKMALLIHAMQYTQLSAVNWNVLGIPEPDKMPIPLRPTGPSLRDLYLPFEFALTGCALSMKFDELRGEPGRPLRISCCDAQVFCYEDQRPLDHYERLGPKDLPFWLRDDIEYPEIERIVIDGGYKP